MNAQYDTRHLFDTIHYTDAPRASLSHITHYSNYYTTCIQCTYMITDTNFQTAVKRFCNYSNEGLIEIWFGAAVRVQSVALRSVNSPLDNVRSDKMKHAHNHTMW